MKKSYHLCPRATKTATPENQADLSFIGGAGDSLWTTPENWESNTVPDNNSTGAAFNVEQTHVILDAATSALCQGFMLGMYGAANTGEFHGGTLDCTWLDIGRINANGGMGTFTVSGGTVTVQNILSIPNQLDSLVDPDNMGTGHVDLLGGSIECSSLLIGNRQVGQGGGIGTLRVTGGTLIVEGDCIDQIQGYIDAGYITSDEGRVLVLDYNATNSGKTTLVSYSGPLGQAQSPSPENSATEVYGILKLNWDVVPAATGYNLYFGTDSSAPSFAASIPATHPSFIPDPLDYNTTYYWRVDSLRNAEQVTGQLWSFTTQAAPVIEEVVPPVTDYCAMLSQEIQGKKHGFLAGNKTNYIGGFMPSWSQSEDETIGFTHPFHNDLRSRGYGMVQDSDTGYGHDLTGWEFYKETKVAYGTVIINGDHYENPVPTAMYWRPDYMVCEYSVGGVAIREEKFIARNDTACSIITSDEPVTIEFSGQSFYKENVTQSTTATCTLDIANNAVHVVEGGVNLVEPVRDDVRPGPIMYDGMSTIISASKPLEDFKNTTESTGQQLYSFTVSCDSAGLSLVWAMNDDSATAIGEAQVVLAAPKAELQAKTEYMNDLLNNQVPYFRCSDQDIVAVYYYLWALYLMYYIDLSDDLGEYFAHTQSAVNNFLGLHRYDSTFQSDVGAWIADKDYYAYGNVLTWKPLLEHANLENGTIPGDNLGPTWRSGSDLSGGLTRHVLSSWKIYEHSGDLNFLSEAYGFFRALMWNSTPGFWGYKYGAATCLSLMAAELGYGQEEIDHWDEMVNRDGYENWLNTMWEKDGIEHYFGGTAGEPLHWTTFAYLAMDDFPQQWARDMVETWAMDSVDGFNAQGQMSTVAAKDWDQILNKNFFITPDTNYFGLYGMYKSGIYDRANFLTLNHLKDYNMQWGVPCAPEAVNENYEFHGDQYSNFNAGKILLILEGMLGLSYSVTGSGGVFTLKETIPTEWSYMESYVPVTVDGQTKWTHVRVDRSEADGVVTKDLVVRSNYQRVLNLSPWLEGKRLSSGPADSTSTNSPDRLDYQYWGKGTHSIRIELTAD